MIDAASSSRCSAARRRRGRSRRARSRASGCGASACSRRMPGSDPESQARIAAFRRRCRDLGWTDGRNMQIDYRWAAGDAEPLRRLCGGIGCTRAGSDPGRRRVGRGGHCNRRPAPVPIVFAQIADPVGTGFVVSLARPGGNATGFSSSNSASAAKWLELLKEIAPRVTRAAVIRDPAGAPAKTGCGAIQAVAPSLGMRDSPIGVRDAARSSARSRAFAREPNGGVIVTTGTAIT